MEDTTGLDKFKYIVIGGGFFGSYLACYLKQRDKKSSVLMIERESDLMKRASFNNQARVHHGYHYPRSFLTAMRSRINYSRFIQEFKECIYDDFEKYYAIGKIQSKVTAPQFKKFCERIGAPIESAPDHIKALFNPNLIEDVFLVKECAFDAEKLKKIMHTRLKENQTIVFYNSEVIDLTNDKTNKYPFIINIKNIKSKKNNQVRAQFVFNCTYSNINTILANSQLPLIDLKQEMTELALVEVPEVLKNKGITVMCGPFFSFMPFPPNGLHTFHHVRYTVHHHWHDTKSNINNQEYYDSALKQIKTNFNKMLKDASRYMPLVNEFTYKKSLWEIKTILPKNENDDGRPILFKKNVGGIKNLFCVMGGKLDNIYDLENELKTVIK